MRYLLLTILLLFSIVAHAQTLTPEDTWTKTERQVYEIISGDGYYVVHFWATWCHNSRSELDRGIWPRLIHANEEVEFIFVTIRDEGKTGADMLADYNIPERVQLFGQEENGSRRLARNRMFMGLPSYWTPTTWVFHQNGKLAYAINYGEVDENHFQTLLDNLKKDWQH